jgi:NAD(P)-dependent dehydrogenase (short-subunit alcohol dehydrogenase family)
MPVSDEHTPRRVLVTGGAGFIGCNFVRMLLADDPAVRIVTLDALTYAGSRENLDDVATQHPDRHRFVQGDVTDAPLLAPPVRRGSHRHRRPPRRRDARRPLDRRPGGGRRRRWDAAVEVGLAGTGGGHQGRAGDPRSCM